MSWDACILNPAFQTIIFEFSSYPWMNPFYYRVRIHLTLLWIHCPRKASWNFHFMHHLPLDLQTCHLCMHPIVEPKSSNGTGVSFLSEIAFNSTFSENPQTQNCRLRQYSCCFNSARWNINLSGWTVIKYEGKTNTKQYLDICFLICAVFKSLHSSHCSSPLKIRQKTTSNPDHCSGELLNTPIISVDLNT